MTSIALDSSANLAPIPLLRRRSALCGYISIQAVDELNSQMLSVAIAWHVYAATHNPMSLAYVGLARFIPSLAASFIAGQAADRLDRRRIIVVCLMIKTLCVAMFGLLLAAGPLSITPLYLLLFVTSAAQAFALPAMSAIMPNLVSEDEFPRAVAVSSSAFQICSLAGPALGGLIYALCGPAMFGISALLYLVALTQARSLPRNSAKTPEVEISAQDGSALGGFRYVWSNRLLLAVISLDLFAVLLGGITALLPIYAKDILTVGPTGLGFLRCAPGVGAAIVGLALAHRTVQRSAGKSMLWCVAGFGCAIVVFALSRSFWLSLAALIAAGAFDMVSMVIRHTVVQIATPDKMRGRVSAVQWIFIGASSELGEFESGATASLFGVVPAALLGGLGTLLVVGLWAAIFPELPRADKIETEPATTGYETRRED